MSCAGWNNPPQAQLSLCGYVAENDSAFGIIAKIIADAYRLQKKQGCARSEA